MSCLCCTVKVPISGVIIAMLYVVVYRQLCTVSSLACFGRWNVVALRSVLVGRQLMASERINGLTNLHKETVPQSVIRYWLGHVTFNIVTAVWMAVQYSTRFLICNPCAAIRTSHSCPTIAAVSSMDSATRQ